MRKKNKLLAFLLIVSFSFFPIVLKSQDDYKFEIGGMVGTSFYMGDANKTKLYKNSSLSGGVIFRYNKDLRWSVKNNFAIGRVSGDTRSSGNKFPLDQQIVFDRMFYEIGSQIELNLFNYSDKFGYLGAKRFTPYVFTGIGMTFGSGNKTFLGVNIPFGMGLKYKMKDRLNLGFEFSFRKLFSDSFDVTNNDGFNLDSPYNIKGNILKNNDWYSLTMFTITWDFGLRVCPCLNSD